MKNLRQQLQELDAIEEQAKILSYIGSKLKPKVDKPPTTKMEPDLPKSDSDEIENLASEYTAAVRQERQNRAIRAARKELETGAAPSAISQGISTAKPRIKIKPGETVQQAIARARQELRSKEEFDPSRIFKQTKRGPGYKSEYDLDNGPQVLKPTPRGRTHDDSELGIVPGEKPHQVPAASLSRDIAQSLSKAPKKARPDWQTDASAWQRFKSGVNPRDVALAGSLGVHSGAAWLANQGNLPEIPQQLKDKLFPPSTTPSTNLQNQPTKESKHNSKLAEQTENDTSVDNDSNSKKSKKPEKDERGLIRRAAGIVFNPADWPGTPRPQDLPEPPRSDRMGRIGKGVGKAALVGSFAQFLTNLLSKKPPPEKNVSSSSEEGAPRPVEIWTSTAEPAPAPVPAQTPVPAVTPVPTQTSDIPVVREPDIRVDADDRLQQAEKEAEQRRQAEKEAEQRRKAERDLPTGQPSASTRPGPAPGQRPSPSGVSPWGGTRPGETAKPYREDNNKNKTVNNLLKEFNTFLNSK